MTPKQEAYARGVLFERKSKRQAYRDAYPSSVKWKDSAVDTAIQDLEKNPRFLGSLERLRAEAEQAMNITRDMVLMELCKVGFSDIENRNISINNKLQALALISKIMGYEQKQPIDVNVNQKPKIIYHAPDNGRGTHERSSDS